LKIGFLEAMQNQKVVAIEGRNNRHVLGFIMECMNEAGMSAPTIVNCEFVPDVNCLFSTSETEENMIQKNYILENLEDAPWAAEAMEKCIDYVKNKGYQIIIILKKRTNGPVSIEEKCFITINNKRLFYPEVEGYMMGTADQKAVAYYGHITPQNYYEALKILLREATHENRGMSRIPGMQYELGLAMCEAKNIPELKSKEEAVLFIKACDKNRMICKYTRKQLAALLNVLKPLGENTVFVGTMSRKRAIRHIENYMLLHNEKWGL
jgi:hypothetical protein